MSPPQGGFLTTPPPSHLPSPFTSSPLKIWLITTSQHRNRSLRNRLSEPWGEPLGRPCAQLTPSQQVSQWEALASSLCFSSCLLPAPGGSEPRVPQPLCTPRTRCLKKGQPDSPVFLSSLSSFTLSDSFSPRILEATGLAVQS